MVFLLVGLDSMMKEQISGSRSGQRRKAGISSRREAIISILVMDQDIICGLRGRPMRCFGMVTMI